MTPGDSSNIVDSAADSEDMKPSSGDMEEDWNKGRKSRLPRKPRKPKEPKEPKEAKIKKEPKPPKEAKPPKGARKRNKDKDSTKRNRKSVTISYCLYLCSILLYTYILITLFI